MSGLRRKPQEDGAGMIPGTDSQSREQIGKVIELLRQTFPDSIDGLYLFGSVISGGLRPASDIDILAVLSAAQNGQVRQGQVRQELIDGMLAISGNPAAHGPARPLELTVVMLDDIVPWRYPPMRYLQFGEWLREDFEARKIPPPQHDPDLAILLATIRQESIPLIGPKADRLLDPVPAEDLRRAIFDGVSALISELEGDERNVLLTLARMWTTLATGRIVPKDVAAEYLLSHLPQEQRPVLDLARALYVSGQRGEWRALGDEVKYFADYMEGLIKGFANGPVR
jgi:streptomycin 3"-adenylyltransferase